MWSLWCTSAGVHTAVPVLYIFGIVDPSSPLSGSSSGISAGFHYCTVFAGGRGAAGNPGNTVVTLPVEYEIN